MLKAILLAVAFMAVLPVSAMAAEPITHYRQT